MFEEIVLSIPVLILGILGIYILDPKYCSRCNCETFFGILQYLHNNENYPIQRYCLKCFFYINLSEWKCGNCKSTGTTRIHKAGFLHRLQLIHGYKNAFINCDCGSIVRLYQK